MDLNYISYFILMTLKKRVYVERSEHNIQLKTNAYSLKKVICKDFVMYICRET